MNIEEIWEEYRLALKRFLHSKVSNEADVDDLLQEILIKTYNNLHLVKKQKSVKSWLFQIANNSIIDFYRKKARHDNTNVEGLLATTDETPKNLDLSYCISPFVNALPDESARLLTAIDINNESQKQYAEKIGVSYSTLKSRVQKSRELLKQIFQECCHFDIDKRGNVYDYEVKSNQPKID